MRRVVLGWGIGPAPRLASVLALVAMFGLTAGGWVAAAQTSTHAAAPVAPHVPLQAFLLAGASDSLADFEAHAHDFGVVYPTYYMCAPGSGRIIDERIVGEGMIRETDDAQGETDDAQGRAAGGEERREETSAIAVYARSEQIAVMPRFSCQDRTTVHTILADPSARERTLAGLVAIADSPTYAGVNLDLENDTSADRGAMTSFVRALARALHAHGRKLSVDIDGVTHEDASISTGFYDDRALAAAADYVFVIAWGTHWEGSAPGPIAPLSYVAAVARYLASLPHADRFVLGVPMYGLDWPVPTVPSAHPRASALQYSNVLTLIHATGASPVLDRAVDEPMFTYTRAGVTHSVWYMDAQSVADRLRVARAYGLQTGVWRLGGEDQALWASPTVVEGALE